MATYPHHMPSLQLQYDAAKIPALVAEYMKVYGAQDRQAEDAGRRIVKGDFSRRNLEVIYRWKSPRSIRRFRKNADAEIGLALKRALNAADVKEAVCSLTSLEGVGVKMASAILTAINPARYTVLDIRALEALGAKNSENLDLYVHYVEACRSMAKKYGVTLRDFDRANWQWSKDKSKPGAAAKHRMASA